jgi:hypothetical protein
MRARRTFGDVKPGHVIVYANRELQVASMVRFTKGRVEITGVLTTGLLSEDQHVVILNWEGSE